MRDAKFESEGRPTDPRDCFSRIARPGAYARTAAAALTRRNECARRAPLSGAARPAIIPFSADAGESGRASRMSAARGAVHPRPTRAA